MPRALATGPRSPPALLSGDGARCTYMLAYVWASRVHVVDVREFCACARGERLLRVINIIFLFTILEDQAGGRSTDRLRQMSIRRTPQRMSPRKSHCSAQCACAYYINYPTARVSPHTYEYDPDREGRDYGRMTVGFFDPLGRKGKTEGRG